jgi:hypothetical protein
VRRRRPSHWRPPWPRCGPPRCCWTAATTGSCMPPPRCVLAGGATRLADATWPRARAWECAVSLSVARLPPPTGQRLLALLAADDPQVLDATLGAIAALARRSSVSRGSRFQDNVDLGSRLAVLASPLLAPYSVRARPHESAAEPAGRPGPALPPLTPLPPLLCPGTVRGCHSSPVPPSRTCPPPPSPKPSSCTSSTTSARRVTRNVGGKKPTRAAS